MISQFALLAAAAAVTFAIPPPSYLGKDEFQIPGYYNPKTKTDFGFSDFSRTEELGQTELHDSAYGHLGKMLTIRKNVTMGKQKSSQDSGAGTYHCHVVEEVYGVEIANTDASLHTDGHGNVIGRTSSWINVTAEMNAEVYKCLNGKSITPVDAVVALCASVGVSLDPSEHKVTPDSENADKLVVSNMESVSNQPVTVQNKLYMTESGLKCVWEVTLSLGVSYLCAFVERSSGKILGSSDWSSSAVSNSDGTRIVKRELPSPPATNQFSNAGYMSDLMNQLRKMVGFNGSGKSGRSGSSVVQRSGGGRSVGRQPRGQQPRGQRPRGQQPQPQPRGQRGQQPRGQPQLEQQQQQPRGQLPSSIPRSSYFVSGLGGIDPRTSAPRTIVNPFDRESSPLGWHDNGKGQGPVSRSAGNNVLTKDNSRRDDNPSIGLVEANDFKFEFKFDDTRQDPRDYKPASITNLFFLCNMIHDVLFKYGFDEASGNFQATNLSGEGRDNDAVQAMAQDGSGLNNANFATPPDGRSGILRMFIFDTRGRGPRRDGSMDNGIVTHEYGHGLSNRLTGGPSRANCLQTTESGGMGEGWSDTLAFTLETVSTDTRTTAKAVGGYATSNSRSGVRQFPYSSDPKVSRKTYQDVGRTRSVHDIGESWAIMLFEVLWNLIDKLGFEPDFTKSKSGKGNTVFMQLLIDGMKLQPCNPNFIQARDAIIQADKNNNGGAHFCEIQKGFAARGLGTGARAGNFVNSFTVDSRCS
ncbi:hypothetical protein BSLG_010746 [Batrachochytrium salamandrivorans]|nr:hypothetical protein BSLG_010746 [Batrachochytrium salamandrivorans]